MLHNTFWPKIGSISDLYKSYSQSLREKAGGNDKVSVVFDGYKIETTKGPEQKRRKKNIASIEVNVDWNLPIPSDKRNFLSSKKNKQQLIDLFAAELIREGISVIQATGDADIPIVKETLSKARDENVVVHSTDTDIFIALVHHISADLHYDVLMAAKSGLVSVNDISLTLSLSLKQCLPFAHAISGCDTVSATYGLGKLRVYNLLKKSSWKNKMHVVGNDSVDIEEIVELGEKFYLEVYGKLGLKAESLDHLREIMYMLPKYIPISRMPPTSRAFRFHMLRAHLEVNSSINLSQTLDPEMYGFYRDAEGLLMPIITDKPPAPNYLLQEIKCSCQKPNRAGLLCTSCGCRKAGLVCNLLCKCECKCDNI